MSAQATATDASNKFSTTTYSTYASGWSTKGATITLRDGGTVALPGVIVRWK